MDVVVVLFIKMKCLIITVIDNCFYMELYLFLCISNVIILLFP